MGAAGVGAWILIVYGLYSAWLVAVFSGLGLGLVAAFRAYGQRGVRRFVLALLAAFLCEPVLTWVLTAALMPARLSQLLTRSDTSSLETALLETAPMALLWLPLGGALFREGFWRNRCLALTALGLLRWAAAVQLVIANDPRLSGPSGPALGSVWLAAVVALMSISVLAGYWQLRTITGPRAAALGAVRLRWYNGIGLVAILGSIWGLLQTDTGQSWLQVKLEGDPGRPLAVPESPVDLAWSPDGKQIAVAGAKTVTVWRVPEGASPRALLYPGPNGDSAGLAWSPDGQLLAAGSREGPQLWRGDLALPLEEAALSSRFHQKNSVHTVAFGPDGSLLAAGGLDGSVGLWTVGDGRLLATLSGHRNLVLSIAFSPDGEMLASGGGDRSIVLWSVSRREQLRTIQTDSRVSDLAFTGDGQLVGSGGCDFGEGGRRDCIIAFWRVQDGSLHGNFRPGRVTGQSLNDRGKKTVLATLEERGAKIWSVGPQGRYELLAIHPARGAGCLQLSPDGQWLAVGSWEQPRVRIWRVP